MYTTQKNHLILQKINNKCRTLVSNFPRFVILIMRNVYIGYELFAQVLLSMVCSHWCFFFLMMVYIKNTSVWKIGLKLLIGILIKWMCAQNMRCLITLITFTCYPGKYCCHGRYNCIKVLVYIALYMCGAYDDDDVTHMNISTTALEYFVVWLVLYMFVAGMGVYVINLFTIYTQMGRRKYFAYIKLCIHIEVHRIQGGAVFCKRMFCNDGIINNYVWALKLFAKVRIYCVCSLLVRVYFRYSYIRKTSVCHPNLCFIPL